VRSDRHAVRAIPEGVHTGGIASRRLSRHDSNAGRFVAPRPMENKARMDTSWYHRDPAEANDSAGGRNPVAEPGGSGKSGWRACPRRMATCDEAWRLPVRLLAPVCSSRVVHTPSREFFTRRESENTIAQIATSAVYVEDRDEAVRFSSSSTRKPWWWTSARASTLPMRNSTTSSTRPKRASARWRKSSKAWRVGRRKRVR